MARIGKQGAQCRLSRKRVVIFVTVGTTMPFDELIAEVDRLAGLGFFNCEVVCQIGQTAYIPKWCEHFRYKEGLGDYFKKADFLIVHGGTGSIIDALMSGKPFLAVCNHRAADDHQGQFLEQVEKKFGVTWTRAASDLSKLYPLARCKTGRVVGQDAKNLCSAILALVE
jgi:UDP-N-acetylglucosamine transferase subunit ALG13